MWPMAIEQHLISPFYFGARILQLISAHAHENKNNIFCLNILISNVASIFFIFYLSVSEFFNFSISISEIPSQSRNNKDYLFLVLSAQYTFLNIIW